ncbi:MAG: hypothetical protein EA374_08495 [Acholeplasmatales bacterium]|nr:MAG: hypothetical protein EA374_08495 [Acholeplasmatales bacterium]
MKAPQHLLRITVFVIGIAIACLALLPVLSFEGLDYTGYEVVFGKTLMDLNPFDLGSIVSAHLPISIFALLAFVLPLAGGIWAFVSKRFFVLTLAGFIIAMVLFIRLPETVEILTVFAGYESTLAVDWSMAYGLVLAIILCAMGILVSLALVFSEYNQK